MSAKASMRRKEWRYLRAIERELRNPPVWVAGDNESRRAAEEEWKQRNKRIQLALWMLDEARQ